MVDGVAVMLDGPTVVLPVNSDALRRSSVGLRNSPEVLPGIFEQLGKESVGPPNRAVVLPADGSGSGIDVTDGGFRCGSGKPWG